MSGPETFPAYENAPEGDQTVAVINSIVEEAGGALSPDELARRVQEHAEEAAGVNQGEVQQYISGLRELSHGAIIARLPAGVGGQYDGSGIEIADSTVEVSGSVGETVDRMQEVMKHEAYHAMNNHLDPMKTAPDAGHYAVVIGGEGFENTELIEGLTVAQTGDQFVSAQYQAYKTRLLSAIGSAGISIGQVEQAVSDKNLTQIHSPVSDGASSPEFAMSA